MAIKFNDEKGLQPEEASIIRQQVAEAWKKAFMINADTHELNVAPETPAGQLVDGITALIVQKDNEVLKLGNMFNPLTAVGIFQDALAKIYFLNRLVDQPTLVSCTCTGLPGTVIPQGSIVEDEEGNRFISTDAATIGNGKTTEIVFACTTPGPIQVNSSTLNKIITVIPGWDSVNNTSAGVVGRFRESQSEFEERRFNSVAKNSHGLSESVGANIANLPTVIATKIVQNRNSDEQTILGVTVPAHSIYLSVFGGKKEEIGQVLYNKLDAGCGTAGNTSVEVIDPINGSIHKFFYTVPSTQTVYIKITTIPDALYDEDKIKNAVINNFNGGDIYPKIIMGEQLFSSRFYQTIINAGLTDLVKVEVSLDGVDYNLNVEFALNKMPVLSAENISFEEAS